MELPASVLEPFGVTGIPTLYNINAPAQHAEFALASYTTEIRGRNIDPYELAANLETIAIIAGADNVNSEVVAIAFSTYHITVRYSFNGLDDVYFYGLDHPCPEPKYISRMFALKKYMNVPSD
jgi:hypothetical protein